MKRPHPFLNRVSYLFLIPAAIYGIVAAREQVWLPICVLLALCVLFNEIHIWASGKKKTTGQRVGKSRPEKAVNQRNRILSKAKATNFRITEDGRFERL